MHIMIFLRRVLFLQIVRTVNLTSTHTHTHNSMINEALADTSHKFGFVSLYGLRFCSNSRMSKKPKYVTALQNLRIHVVQLDIIAHYEYGMCRHKRTCSTSCCEERSATQTSTLRCLQVHIALERESMRRGRKNHSPVTVTMHAGTLFENPRQPHLAHNSVFIPCSWCLAHLTYKVIFLKVAK